MNIFEIHLLGEVYWKISANDPVTQDLKSLPGFFFINPVLYPKFNLPFQSSNCSFIIDNLGIFATNRILLGSSLENFDIKSITLKLRQEKIIRISSIDAPEDDFMEVLNSYIELLTTSLRQASKQVSVPLDVVSFRKIEVDKLPAEEFPKVGLSGNSFFQRYVWDTGIMWNQLIEADENLLNPQFAIYEKLILDAIHAFKSKDYRKALLYSAISIETLAANKLENFYNCAVQTNSTSLHLVSLPKSGGQSVIKDPIYDLLLRKSKFKEYLHEIPLYLMGKSLLIENQDLYNNAVKLYATRNKIAHHGESANNNQATFEMNADDALEAIELTLDVFRWFGEKADFPLPKFGFISGCSPI